MISTVEKNASGVLITGFEYTYDILGRVSTEKYLDKNIQMCYTYDERSRVTQRVAVNYNTGETIDETFTYDAAGNIISATDDCCDTDSFSYDANNRLTYHNGMSVTYDADGNMTSAYHDGSRDSFRYDSTNRLIGTNTNAYTYNAENVRIRNLCGDSETTYVYNTNAKLSSMLMKTTDGVVTKYVYGRGLIGEETNGVFKTYHFDYRGSTVAITDINGDVTDTFEYDTYGKVTNRTGNSDVIFLYNGRDGVVTDANGLIYMRARYYSPELRRFINADILAGDIANAVTLNRYAYANANPVSLIDPKGLSAERVRYPLKSKSERWMDLYNYTTFDLRSLFRTDLLEAFEVLTAYGLAEGIIDLVIGASQDENGYYYISQDYWQSAEYVGYNSLYDYLFSIGAGIAGETEPYYDKISFSVDDTTYTFWWWKGDYLALGAGAELGIYKEPKDSIGNLLNLPPLNHVYTATDEKLKMSMTLEDTKKKKTIFHFTPEEYQWWVNQFDPFTQGIATDDMRVTVNIDFSDNGTGLFEAFYNQYKNNSRDRWIFDESNQIATLVY